MPYVKRNSGIYCIENRVNGKRYIGQASNIERRLYEHRYYLERGRDKCVALQRAVNKYGLESFDMYILENCETDQDIMNEREIYYISKYNTHNRHYGYNISSGGNQGLLGYKWPLEFGKKISMAKKGMKLSEDTKKKISEATKGKPKSEETRRRMSENHSRHMLGKKFSAETVEKLKTAHGGTNAYQFGKKNPNSSSKYFGVGKLVQRGFTYWSVNIKFKGVRTYIGMSKDELAAARMYDAYVIEHGLPNPLNFPEDS